MKKLLSVLIICLMIGAGLSAQMLGPMRHNMPGSMPQFASCLYSWSGTLEYRDGYSYLRDKDNLVYLLVGIPKKEGLTLDTCKSMIQVQVWGSRIPTLKNEILVENMSINGVEQLLIPWWFAPLNR